MRITTEIYEPLYDYNNRKYIKILIPPDVSEKVKYFHKKYPDCRFNPLDGNVLTIKVPYRYKRVMVNMKGAKGVSSFVLGDKVEMLIEFRGQWKLDDEHTGMTWILKETTYIE